MAEKVFDFFPNYPHFHEDIILVEATKQIYNTITTFILFVFVMSRTGLE